MIAVGLWAAQTGGRCDLGGAALPCVSVHAPRWRLRHGRSSFRLLRRGRYCCLPCSCWACSSQRRCGCRYRSAFLLSDCLPCATDMPTVPRCLRAHPCRGMPAGGFALATALLHIAGIDLGWASRKLPSAKLVRFAGGAIALVWYRSSGSADALRRPAVSALEADATWQSFSCCCFLDEGSME